MKKAIIVLIFSAIACASMGQELGLRFGEVTGGHVAIDGVFSLAEFSRVHADASFGDGGLGIDALWDFIYKPLGPDGLQWYAGAGGFLFLHDPFWFGLVGEIGLEYKITEAPVVIGLDWRPAFSIIQETDLYAKGFGLNIRYVFGK